MVKCVTCLDNGLRASGFWWEQQITLLAGPEFLKERDVGRNGLRRRKRKAEGRAVGYKPKQSKSGELGNKWPQSWKSPSRNWTHVYKPVQMCWTCQICQSAAEINKKRGKKQLIAELLACLLVLEYHSDLNSITITLISHICNFAAPVQTSHSAGGNSRKCIVVQRRALCVLICCQLYLYFLTDRQQTVHDIGSLQVKVTLTITSLCGTKSTHTLSAPQH